jgi:hypothetical protein
VAHAGVNDVKKHIATSKHRDSLKAVTGHQSLTTLFRSDMVDQVTRAEVLFANFLTEHNLSFMTADHFTRLTSVMFPDSKIAQEFRCARTKATCIVKGALYPHLSKPVVTLCQTGPFSILCDESNKGDDKSLAILVRMWDNCQRKPVTRFLDMPVCNIATAEKLFECIDTVLVSSGIPWSNVVGLESDTCNVMMGRHNSVLSRVKEKQPLIFSIGCVCHLVDPA